MRDVRVLLRDLGSPEWWIRSSAIKDLLQYPEEDYFPFLENALRDHDNANLRNASMECYKALSSRALPSLRRLIADDDPEVRLFAANLLGDIADTGTAPDLINAMKDPDCNVRIASAEALGKIRDARAVNILREALNDEPWVAMASIKALGEIGGDESLKALYSCLEREEYRGLAFDAIEKAGNEHAIRYLTPFVDRDEMRELALKAVVNIADRRGIRLMPEYFMNMTPLLIGLQGSQDPEVKRAAFIALAWTGDPEGLPFFIDALNDEDLQEYAIRGFLGIGKKAVPEIIDALRDSGRPQRIVLAKLLAMLGEHEALLQFSRDYDPEVRVEVALALAKINSAETVGILSRMMNDPDEEVRMAAYKISRGLGKAV